MTDNQKMRVSILANQFHAQNKSENPHIRSGKVFEEWYSTRGMLSNEPIPKEMLPTKEEYLEWDRQEAEYIAIHLKNYTTLLAYWEDAIGTPIEEVIAAVIAETRPCGCVEAQCNLFCPYYGTENCK